MSGQIKSVIYIAGCQGFLSQVSHVYMKVSYSLVLRVLAIYSKVADRVIYLHFGVDKD